MKTFKFSYYIKLLLILGVCIQTISCSKDDDEPVTYPEPGAATLVLPLNNQECETGGIIANKSYVTFEWSAATNADAYDLTIVNAQTDEITQRLNIDATTVDVPLDRASAYTWTVTSKNKGDVTTVSDEFSFYVSGDSEGNSVPDPATLVSPYSGEIVAPANGQVTLIWESPAVDADGDELSFTVFIDQVDGNQTPSEELTGLKEQSATISIMPSTTYYWHVETFDGKHTSISNTLTFKTDEENTVQGRVVSTPSEFIEAVGTAIPGETIYVRGGEYIFDDKIQINISGNTGSMISLLPHPSNSTRPLLNFSSMEENSSNRGLDLSASYWYIYGMDVFGAGDNGMFISGSNNVIEFCTFSENHDTGLQIGNGGSNNTIINCDSYFNADSSLENADGFACKLDAGTDNAFIGCRAWQNLDDGWDGYMRGNDDITTTYENCWAIRNGLLKDGTVGVGDGNGFKTGGSDNKDLKHNALYTHCIAVGNTHDGFDHNSNRGEVTIYNSSAFDNGDNYNFGNTNALAKLTIKNCNSLGDYGSANATEADVTNNSWQDGITSSVDDFESIDYGQLLNPRKADGSLPDVTFFNLKADSDMIDKGVDVGLSFNGLAPDLGYFEY